MTIIPFPLATYLQIHALVAALVLTMLGASPAIVAWGSRENGARPTWTSAPASPARTAPCARTMSTALCVNVDPALTAYCVKTTSRNAPKGWSEANVLRYPLLNSWMPSVVTHFVTFSSYLNLCKVALAHPVTFNNINPPSFTSFTSSSCLNNGTCIDDINTFSCRCRPGFYGTFCEYEQNECDSQPCKNGGTCTDGLGTYRCTCPVGYNGPNCQVHYMLVCAPQERQGSSCCTVLSSLTLRCCRNTFFTYF